MKKLKTFNEFFFFNEEELEKMKKEQDDLEDDSTLVKDEEEQEEMCSGCNCPKGKCNCEECPECCEEPQSEEEFKYRTSINKQGIRGEAFESVKSRRFKNSSRRK